MTSPPDLASLASVLASIAREAAAITLAGWRSGVTVERKGAIDLVTEYDRASESLIRARVARELPDIDLVAEEGGGSITGDRFVLWADPLDGTTTFAHGHPFFAVSLGVMDGSVPLAGVVSAPALGVTWVAWRGGGAWRNGVRCTVSATATLGDSLLATGFPYDNPTNPEANFREFAGLTRRSRGVRRCGSAALDLCYVADGTYDGYWERFLKPWDLAAGSIVVTEAGGTVTALDGTPSDPRVGALAATNGRVHHALLAAVRASRDEAT